MSELERAVRRMLLAFLDRKLKAYAHFAGANWRSLYVHAMSDSQLQDWLERHSKYFDHSTCAQLWIDLAQADCYTKFLGNIPELEDVTNRVADFAQGLRDLIHFLDANGIKVYVFY